MAIQQRELKSNGYFSILKDPYNKEQHPNQLEGLDLYVDVVDHSTGFVNSVKLYKNTKGLHFKKGRSWYLGDFDKKFLYVPFQIIELRY